MNEILSQQEQLSKKIQKDVESLYDTIAKIDLNRFNKQSKFTWKVVYTGYTDRVTIFIKKGFFDKRILIYDIERSDCYLKLVKEQNTEIFEAVEEATKWIQGEIELIEKSIKEYSQVYHESSKSIKTIIESYESLRRAYEG